jgi:hypothetical protein
MNNPFAPGGGGGGRSFGQPQSNPFHINKQQYSSNHGSRGGQQQPHQAHQQNPFQQYQSSPGQQPQRRGPKPWVQGGQQRSVAAGGPFQSHQHQPNWNQSSQRSQPQRHHVAANPFTGRNANQNHQSGNPFQRATAPGQNTNHGTFHSRGTFPFSNPFNGQGHEAMDWNRGSSHRHVAPSEPVHHSAPVAIDGAALDILDIGIEVGGNHEASTVVDVDDKAFLEGVLKDCVDGLEPSTEVEGYRPPGCNFSLFPPPRSLHIHVVIFSYFKFFLMHYIRGRWSTRSYQQATV